MASIDVGKDPRYSPPHQPIYLRRGEKGKTFEFVIKDFGDSYSLTGLTAQFKATLSTGAIIVEDATVNVSAGTVTYTVSDNLTSIAGACKRAYVELTNGSSKVITTEDVGIVILDNVDLSSEKAETYTFILDALIEDANTAIENANKAKATADEATTENKEAVFNAEQATEKANTAAENADTSAKNADEKAAACAVYDTRISTLEGYFSEETIDGFDTIVVVPLGLYKDADGDVCQKEE